MEVQTLLAISLGGLLLQHPRMSRFLDIVGWMLDHPFWSIAITLLIIISIVIIIKNIVRGIETVGVAILQAPFRLLWEAIKFIFKWLRKGLIWGWRKLKKQPDSLVIEEKVAVEAEKYRQQQIQTRLAEITQRLTQIQQEQAELLQEAAVLIESNNNDISAVKQVNNKVENKLLQASKVNANINN